MVILTGSSLNERHRELNSKVNEGKENGMSLDYVKLEKENIDIDRIFRIDLANKRKDVDYIIQTLKSGDSLYVTRAMKCSWLYDEAYSHIVNPEHLERRIFPQMSFKMKRKFLTMIFQHMTNNDLAESFYTFCMEIKLPNIARKFLLYTSEKFKAEIIKRKSLVMSDNDIINVVGNSFTLATIILDEAERCKICYFLKRFCYLYSASATKYLDLIEKYITKHGLSWEIGRLGLRISKNIVKKHKHRLLCNIVLYTNMINKKMLAKHSSEYDVKKYIALLLPPQCQKFWSESFYNQYDFLLNVIPFEERLQYIKRIFNSLYPEKQFEMDINFYYSGLYKLMTLEERELWAMRHIIAGLEHFGDGHDYLWYKLVSFEKAFESIKRYILSAANAELRTSIVNVLVSSAQSDRDLEALFNYYYERFVNEIISNKEKFIDEVLSIHKYYNFDEACWNAFDVILYSMDVYAIKNSYFCKIEYKVIAINYAIINKRELHMALENHIEDGSNMYILKQQTDKLPEQKAEMVYQYIMNLYVEKINHFYIENSNEDTKYNVKKYVHNVLQIMSQYNKPKKDIPDVVNDFIQLEPDEYRNHVVLKKDESNFPRVNLIKDLKSDRSLVISKISPVEEYLYNTSQMNIRKLLRKIKIYFSNDIALKYLELYKELLASDDLNERTYNAAVYGLLFLADDDCRVDFISQYIPTEPKIPHATIERRVLYIRKAVCKYMCVARPAVPMSIGRRYIVGDYLKFCLPMFQSYEANLPPDQLIEFVKILLQSPASIQKHGIRMAFQCFSVNILKTIVSDIWKKNKNVSLRMVMYHALHRKINEQEESLQKELFNILKDFTIDLREDDENEVFILMTATQLPSCVLGEHILSAWQVLNALPNKRLMIKRKCTVVRNMAKHLSLMEQNTIDNIVTEHIRVMLKEEEILKSNKYDSHINELNKAKWHLTAKYLMYMTSVPNLQYKLNITETIVKECVRLWDRVHYKEYIVRDFVMGFLSNLVSSICYKDMQYCTWGPMIFNKVLVNLQKDLPLPETYDAIWYLELSIITANTIIHGRSTFSDTDDEGKKSVIFSGGMIKFATQFVALINDNIEKGTFYPSSNGTLKRYLKKFSSIVLDNWPFSVANSAKSIVFIVSSKLLEIDKYETQKLALEILPVCTDGQEYSPSYRNSLRLLKLSKYNDIKYLFYKKFVSDNDYDTFAYLR